MLTGDNPATAAAVARAVGVSDYAAQLFPADKERVVRETRAAGKTVMMVGDGINDAPALAGADVGVAIGAGTDVAIEAADVVLASSDLLAADTLLQLARRTLRNIKENLFWALIYNTLGIPLAAGVFWVLLNWTLDPMIAAAAMSLSSVCVVGNALRLRRFKPVVYGNHTHAESSAPQAVPVGQVSARQKQQKEEHPMKIKLKIEGMSCGHCSARVEQALNSIEGITAKVDLQKKEALVESDQPIDRALLVEAVDNAGYQVVD